MSDSNDKAKGTRRRKRRGFSFQKESNISQEDSPEPSPLPTKHSSSKPPIIAKRDKTSLNKENNGPEENIHTPINLPDKPTIIIKSREETRLLNGSITSPVNSEETPASPTPTYKIQRPSSTSASVPPIILHPDGSPQSRLAIPTEIGQSVKIVDESMQWCENAMEFLKDQTEFHVIGIIGSQGSGKSTILSMLAGTKINEPSKSFIFKPQGRVVKEICANQTLGIDMYISSERVIYLDAQPILSSSLLYQIISHEKKSPNEFTASENNIEMQSLQILSFMYTVCHVVLVVTDWFADLYFLRFLQTAEMLKPPTPSSGLDGSPVHEDNPEYFPHLVFLLNKASRSEFSPNNYKLMCETLCKLFENSNLKWYGSTNMSDRYVLPGMNFDDKKVNLFLLPNMEAKINRDGMNALLPGYMGHPSFEYMIRSLRKQLFSMQRSLLTHTTLSEKNWFHYAARTWEGIKKYQIFSEYSRLLP